MQTSKPCYKCEDRTVEPNCHMTCEKYAKLKDEIETLKAIKKEASYLHTRGQIKRHDAWVRRKRK